MQQMAEEKHIFYLRDAQDNLCGVQLSASLWELARPAVEKALARLMPPEEAAEPLEDFRQFLEYWDFKYPYDPAVKCPHCGAETDDWRTDSAHPFHLTTANLGGLLVFRCARCHTTIRQKHFRDHRALEHTVYEG